MRRGSEFVFSRVPTADIPRSSFNRSHTHKTTIDAGYLYPIYVDEALPGDTFQVNMSCFARLATPIFPVMDNMYLDVFFFAVPNRLVWNNWQRFMGEQDNPDDSTDFLVPQVDAGGTGFAPGSLFDYMGLPVEIPGISCSALHARAYNLIWNEWFRDENLQDSLVINKSDSADVASAFPIQRRGKRHDYFTSCLPWPQKGPGVELPIGGLADVLPVDFATGPVFQFANQVGDTPTSLNVAASGQSVQHTTVNTGGSASPLRWDDPHLYADLSTATGVTINSMRTAFQVQKLLERDARGGTRYTEILRSHFGVVSPDARLQRPEYLGGGSLPVNINPVAQTSGTPPTSGGYTMTPQGNLAAFGTVGGSNLGFSKSFVEHCVIVGLVEVRAELSYQQGMHRMWSRRSRYDFYWPAFSHLGEQAVMNREIYCQGPSAVNPSTQVPYDDEVFGYQERFAEYRYFPSKITGKFRSGLTGGSLDAWHLSQEFLSLPVLNAEFIQDAPPVDRVIAVQDEPHFLFDSHFGIKCTRPMPTYSVPGYIDHF